MKILCQESKDGQALVNTKLEILIDGQKHGWMQTDNEGYFELAEKFQGKKISTVLTSGYALETVIENNLVLKIDTQYKTDPEKAILLTIATIIKNLRGCDFQYAEKYKKGLTIKAKTTTSEIIKDIELALTEFFAPKKSTIQTEISLYIPEFNLNKVDDEIGIFCLDTLAQVARLFKYETNIFALTIHMPKLDFHSPLNHELVESYMQSLGMLGELGMLGRHGSQLQHFSLTLQLPEIDLSQVLKIEGGDELVKYYAQSLGELGRLGSLRALQYFSLNLKALVKNIEEFVEIKELARVIKKDFFTSFLRDEWSKNTHSFELSIAIIEKMCLEKATLELLPLTSNSLMKLSLKEMAFSEDSLSFLLKQLGNINTLTELDLSGDDLYLDEEALALFIEVLKKNINLIYLNLSHNSLTEETILRIRESLKNHNQLKTLDFSLNTINPKINTKLRIRVSHIKQSEQGSSILHLFETQKQQEKAYPSSQMELSFNNFDNAEELAAYAEQWREKKLGHEFVNSLTEKCKEYQAKKQNKITDWPLKGAIKAIGCIGSYFNLELARFLVFQMIGEREVKAIIEALQQIHSDLISISKENPEQDLTEACKAYKYLAINPLLKMKIPSLQLLQHITLKNDEPKLKVSNDLKFLCQALKDKSEKISRLASKIDSLESNKRQPLELFNLRNEYDKLSSEYKRESDKQTELINNLRSNKP